MSAGLPAAPPCPVDREVGDGDVLAFGGGAHVVHAPGHTAGSLALHLPGPRVLFTGDTVAEHGGAVILGPFNQDRRRALESFRLLTALDADLALVGHGEPVGRSGSLMPARARRTASDTDRTAASWPMTRAERIDSIFSSFAVSPSSSRPAGMPVQAATTSATSSGPTSSLSITSAPGAVTAVASASCFSSPGILP